MSTNRTLATLKRIESTETSLVEFYTGEKTSFQIRNDAIKAMEANNADVVSIKKMQSHYAKDNSSASATHGGVLLLFLGLVEEATLSNLNEFNNNDAKNFSNVALNIALITNSALMIAVLAYTLINIVNGCHHKNTEDGCAEWLEQRSKIKPT